MFQSTIIIDPKSEIRGRQDINTYVVAPGGKGKRTVVRMEDIRSMLAWSSKSSFTGDPKTIIIERFDQSSPATPHAILKLLEEPPANTRIFLLVDQRQSVLETIISRCAVIESSAITAQQLRDWGMEKIVDKTPASMTPWQEFHDFSEIEKWRWAEKFTKSKKDLSAQLTLWLEEIGQRLATADATTQARHIRELSLADEALEATIHNVLGRLILDNLIIGLVRLSQSQK